MTCVISCICISFLSRNLSLYLSNKSNIAFINRFNYTIELWCSLTGLKVGHTCWRISPADSLGNPDVIHIMMYLWLTWWGFLIKSNSKWNGKIIDEIMPSISLFLAGFYYITYLLVDSMVNLINNSFSNPLSLIPHYSSQSK